MNADRKIEKCRACLVDNISQLFDWNALPDNFPENQSYLQIFTDCTRIDASPDLPQKLCYGCASQLRVASLLIRKCRESDLLLRVKQEKVIALSESEFMAVPALAPQIPEEILPTDLTSHEYEEPMDFGENEYFRVSGASSQAHTSLSDENQEYFAASDNIFAGEESESQNNSVTIKEESDIHKMLSDVLHENRRLRVQNETILTHFTEEFIALKRKVEQTLTLTQEKRRKINLDRLPHFPLTAAAAVLEFEEDLRKDEEMKKQLNEKYGCISSDNPTKFIHDNIKMIFGDDTLCSNFSWTNTNSNIAVKDLSIIKILIDSCIQNIEHAKTDRAEEDIKKFFNGAKDRLKKSEKRKALKYISFPS